MAYYRTVHRILGHQSDPDLNLAMRQAAAACGLHEGGKHEQETTIPHRDLRSMVTAIWCDKRDLHTAIGSNDTEPQKHPPRIAARLETTLRHHREWHERRAKDLAQEQQRYLKNPRPYKSLKHVEKILGETRHRGIGAVRLQDGTLTNDPKVVIEEVLNSFKRQQNAEDGELSDYTKHLISHLPQVYNRAQQRDVHRTPFTIRELDEVLHKRKPGKTPGVDGLPAPPEEAPGGAPLGHSHREGRHTTGLEEPRTPLVQERRLGKPGQLEAHCVRYHGSEAHLDAHHETSGPSNVPGHPTNDVGSNTGTLTTGGHLYAGRWGAYGPHQPHHHVSGRQEAFSQHPSTALYRPSGKTWDFPFKDFYRCTSPPAYTRYKPMLAEPRGPRPTSEVPQGGAEGPFLFLLFTLPLAFQIRRTYPDVAPYPLRTTLLAFVDDMAVVTATARQPLPDARDNVRANQVLHDVTSYLESNRLLVQNVK